MLDELPDDDELVLVEDDVLLLPADEAAGAAVVVVDAGGVDGALDEDSVFTVAVAVGAAFEVSPEGGFILSE